MNYKRTLAIALPLLAIFTFAIGCAKKDADTDDDQPRTHRLTTRGTSKGPAVAASKELIKAPLDGIITGRVMLTGDRPVSAPIEKMLTHNDHAFCLMGTEKEKVDPKWLISKDGGVANVVIFLKAPPGKYFPIKDADKKLTGKKVMLDQPHCAFLPHVAGIFPAYYDGKTYQPTGEEFVVKNDAPFNHNTKWAGNPLTNAGGNRTLKSKEEWPISVVPESNPIQFSCDIHPWMYARVWAFDNPYFAVTKEDGTFQIKDVPTGVELGLVAWHEATGFFHGGKDGTKQKFNPGENKVDLTISAK